MLLTNIHIFIHVRLNFFHGIKSHGVYKYTYILNNIENFLFLTTEAADVKCLSWILVLGTLSSCVVGQRIVQTN
jgi:hypothetical protein